MENARQGQTLEAPPEPDAGVEAQRFCPCRRERLLGWGLAALLVAPSAAWVAKDRAIWSWDPASYATESVDLWFRLTSQPDQWLGRMRSVFPAKAPGTAWLGQFFVPVGRWIGSIEIGLLASVLLAQIGTLVLIHRLGRRIAPSSALPALAGTLFVAAGPMFVAVSHHFLTEALQLFSIAYLLWVAVESSSGPPIGLALHLLLAASLCLVAKFSTPAFVFLPACVAGARVLRRIVLQRERLLFGARELFLGAVLVVVAAMGLSWYLRNGKQAYDFARLATSSGVALDYGSRGTVLVKLEYWLGAMGSTLVIPWTAWLVVAGLPFAAWISARRVRDSGAADARGSGLLAIAAIAQVTFLLAVLATSVNEETRYLVALAPTLALVLVWVLAGLRSRWAPALVVAVLSVQWGVVNARQLGWVGGSARYWERAPSPDASRRRELVRVEGEVCRKEDGGRPIMTGVDLDWLNYCTLAFLSAIAQLDRGFRCGYEYLGHAQKDPVAGFEKIREIDAPYFVSLEEAAMPQPPDFLNTAALEVLQRVRQDPGFALVPLESESHIVVFRRVASRGRRSR